LSDLEIIRTIADELPVGVWVACVPGGELAYANRKFAEIMGITARSDVVAGGYAQPYGIHTRSGALYPEADLPFVRAMREQNTVTVDDIVIHRHDGAKVYIRAFAKPLLDAAGAMTHIAIAFIDITPEVLAEARLRQAQRMQSIGTLAGGVAHDFNNLLAPISLVAGNLLRAETDERRREGLQIICDVAERAVTLTRALLGFAGHGKHLARPLPLARVAVSLVELARRTFDRRLELALDCAADTGDVVGDESQLEQVVMNLLINARDAMPGGGPITVRTFRAGDSAVLEVIDAGTGIDPVIRDRIFEPYFTTKTSGPVRGTGLGLATVYGIVHAHRGSVEVEDRSPGTVMRVRLPRAPQSGPAEPVSAPRDTLVSGTGTILVIDDEPTVLQATAQTLESLGYQVLRARDGVEAVEIYRQHHADIAAVVLDMVMPRLDGRSTYQALRAIEPSVRVLLMTGYALNEEAQAILDAGVRGFLPKPCSPERLSSVLAEVVAGR
jgi:signal transduction histidine kinase/CheY-like chemotaxis protein